MVALNEKSVDHQSYIMSVPNVMAIQSNAIVVEIFYKRIIFEASGKVRGSSSSSP